MTSSFYVPLIIIGFAIYFLYMRNAAIEARGRLAERVDAFLGNENVPEPFKMVVYFAFSDCLDHLLPLKIVYFFAFYSNNKSDLVEKMNQLEEECDKDCSEEYRKIISELALINIRLAPVSYIVSGLLMTTSVLITVLFKNVPLSSIPGRLERTVLKAVH